MARLEERATHARQAGAPAEYRQVKTALTKLEAIGRQLIAPLWDEMQLTLPPGLAERGELQVAVSPEDFVPWLADRARLRLVTGQHDAESVEPLEVGSGLQSLLELAAQQAAGTPTGKSRILAIEEPEAFLHPSAQRTLARLIARTIPGKRIVSTHSPLLVEEASYGEVVLVRSHRFFEPSALAADDPTRAAINTALLTGFGAEMAFACSVLLVEGEGDRLYFEWLRRRIARGSGDGLVDEAYVLPTGSKTSFSPWLQLLSSYGRAGDRPVAWLAVADSDGAVEIRRAWRDAGLTLHPDVLAGLEQVAKLSATERPALLAAARLFNQTAAVNDETVHLLPVDLEQVMIEHCSATTVANLCSVVGAPRSNKSAFETWLGNNKAPWMRAVIARDTPWPQVSDDAKAVLHRWLGGAMPEVDARRVVDAMA